MASQTSGGGGQWGPSPTWQGLYSFDKTAAIHLTSIQTCVTTFREQSTKPYNPNPDRPSWAPTSPGYKLVLLSRAGFAAIRLPDLGLARVFRRCSTPSRKACKKKLAIRGRKTPAQETDAQLPRHGFAVSNGKVLCTPGAKNVRNKKDTCKFHIRLHTACHRKVFRVVVAVAVSSP